MGGILLIFVFLFASSSAIYLLPDELEAKYRSYLGEFDTKRHHYQQSEEQNLYSAINFIKAKFENASLETVLHNFTTSETTTGESVSGTNLIGILKGKYYNTADDRVVILGAHLDTRGLNGYGVINDGSGLVGLITIAEDLAGTDRCSRNHTVLFVAFDRSETSDVGQGKAVCNRSCGSVAFVADISTIVTRGEVNLAIIMDCIMNFDQQGQTQDFPQPIKTYFANFVNVQGQVYSNKGNYIAAVGREDEQDVLDQYEQFFENAKRKTNSQYRVGKFKWNFMGTPSGENLTNVRTAFKESDYLSFWDGNMKSILLTDTCYERSYLFACKTGTCDRLGPAMLGNRPGFMYTTVSAVKDLTKSLVCGERDVDECSIGASNCSENANCFNEFGSYTCKCKAGYAGDGQTCADIDECQGNLPCSAPNMVCTNRPGGYDCSCKAGFKQDGPECNRIASGGSTVMAILCHIVMLAMVGWLEVAM